MVQGICIVPKFLCIVFLKGDPLWEFDLFWGFCNFFFVKKENKLLEHKNS